METAPRFFPVFLLVIARQIRYNRIMIRPVKIEDAVAICGIYNYYVANTVITFDEEPYSVGDMEKKIREIGAAYPWFVREDEGEVLGYAYVNSWRERVSYRYSAEVSIYVRDGYQGRGIGSGLFACLLEAVKKSEIHALVSAITLPNERSAALQEKFGFRKIAQLDEIGFKDGRWLDVGYWERILAEQE
jgi:phosphinothricin acetyltransferase